MADEMEFDEDLLFSEFEAVDDRPADFSSYREKNTEDPPSMDLKALKEENCQLKQLLKRLLVPETCKHGATTDIEKPFFHAVFFNNQASTEGRQKLELFLHTLATIKPDSVNGHDSSLEQSFSFSSLQPSVCPLNAFVNDVDAESETSRKDSVDLSNDSPFSVINCAQYFEFYCIDPCGFPLVSYTSTSEAEGWEVPVYDQIFFTAIPCNEDSSKVKVKRKRACFNCGNVGHNLSECPEPLNQARIDATRQQFIKNFSSPFSKVSRYHVDEKKFGAFKPGVASSALREALGIRSDEVPHYIYKMRLLGYPPGYIPSTSNSTLVIYNADGNVEDYVMEDVDEEDEEDDEKIKKSIFVEYPGFNCPLPKDIRDRSRELGYPPMSPQQSIWYWQYKETIQIPNNGSRDPRCTNKRGWTEANDGAGDMELDVEDQGPAPELLNIDIDTVRKRRKLDEANATGEGGYSPTHPDLQYGSTEQHLLDRFNQSSSTSSSKKSTNQPPLPCELTATRNEDDTNAKPSKKKSGIQRIGSCLEDGEIISDDEGVVEMKSQDDCEDSDERDEKVNQGWWLTVPLTSQNLKSKPLVPPPVPSVKLPMDLLTRFYTSCTALHSVSFEDRIMWLDPIYGNIQVSSGRFDKLKEILQQRRAKRGRQRRK